VKFGDQVEAEDVERQRQDEQDRWATNPEFGAVEKRN
jgi:hypothetical protein